MINADNMPAQDQTQGDHGENSISEAEAESSSQERDAEPKSRKSAGRLLYVTAAETAALLDLTEDLLRNWRATGYGPRARRCASGWGYHPDEIECLRAIPWPKRLFSIRRAGR